MKKKILFFITINSYLMVHPIPVEHAYPSDYITNVLAQKLTHEKLQQLRNNEPVELKKSPIQTNDPDTTIEASFIINCKGDKIIITSDIKNTSNKQFENADELTRAQELFAKFKERSLYPDADIHSRCNHNKVDSTLKEDARLFNRTVQTSCTTEMSMAEFMELIKLYKTARN